MNLCSIRVNSNDSILIRVHEKGSSKNKVVSDWRDYLMNFCLIRILYVKPIPNSIVNFGYVICFVDNWRREICTTNGDVRKQLFFVFQLISLVQVPGYSSI